MASIHIKNIGPLVDTGIVPLTRVMLLLGPQGSGKSTLMKILCYCRWIEKEITLNGDKQKYYNQYRRFYKTLCKFHRLSDDFFSQDSYIHYEGDTLRIIWKGTDTNVKCKRHSKQGNKGVIIPKLSFIPAERNLVSAIANIDKAYRGNPSEDMLFNYVLELGEARSQYGEEAQPLELSINRDLSYFSSSLGQDMIKMTRVGKVIQSYYASSGIQSAFPIDLISSYLFGSIGKPLNMTPVEMLRRFAYDNIELFLAEDWEKIMTQMRAYQYGSIQLYIEEPEQNLYPESQRDLLLSLLSRMLEAKERESSPSSLIMTTHSPYMLSVMNTQITLARAYQYLTDEVCDEPVKQRICDELQQFSGQVGHLSVAEYSAYFITPEGYLHNLIEDEEFPMVSGVRLDGVSDWVDDYTEQIYRIIYHDSNNEQ